MGDGGRGEGEVVDNVPIEDDGRGDATEMRRMLETLASQSTRMAELDAQKAQIMARLDADRKVRASVERSLAVQSSALEVMKARHQASLLAADSAAKGDSTALELRALEGRVREGKRKSTSSLLAELDALRAKVLAEDDNNDGDGNADANPDADDNNDGGDGGGLGPGEGVERERSPKLAAGLDAEDPNDDEPTETYAMCVGRKRMEARVRQEAENDGEEAEEAEEAACIKKRKIGARRVVWDDSSDDNDNDKAEATTIERHRMTSTKLLAQVGVVTTPMDIDQPTASDHVSALRKPLFVQLIMVSTSFAQNTEYPPCHLGTTSSFPHKQTPAPVSHGMYVCRQRC